MTSFFNFFWSRPPDAIERRLSEQPFSPPAELVIRLWTERAPQKRPVSTFVFDEVNPFRCLGLDIKRRL